MADIPVHRRHLLATLGGGTIVGVTGCTGDDETGDETAENDGADSGDTSDSDRDPSDDDGSDDDGQANDDGHDEQRDEPSPDLSITALTMDSTTVSQTEKIQATATVENTGGSSGPLLLELHQEGSPFRNEEMALDQDESMQIEGSFEALRPGDHVISAHLYDAEEQIHERTTTLTIQPSPETFVDVTRTSFTLDGETHFVSGAEPKPPYVDGLGHPNPEELREIIFEGLETIDANVARLHGYSYVSIEEGTPFPGEDNEAFFERFDKAIVEAKRRGIRLSVNIINGAPHYHHDPEDHFGMHVPAFVEAVDGAETIDDFFAHEGCIQLYKDWVSELLTRENHLTGVEYRNDPTIMLWELGNEIQWEAGWERGDGPSLRQWIEEVAPHVQEVMQENQLLTTGVHGWPDGRNDFYDDHAPDSIDVCSIHWWAPGPLHYADYTPEQSHDLFDTLIETAHEVLGKPVWIGEYNWGYGDDTEPAAVDEALIDTRNASLETWHDRFDEEDVAGVALHELGSQQIHEELFGHEGPGSSTVYADAHDSTVAEVRRYAEKVRSKSGEDPPAEPRETYFLSPDGDDANPGSETNPLRTIDEGIRRAHAGDTLQLAPGEYRDEVQTRRSGKPDAPITITGPEDAVWRAHEFTDTLFDIAHSHIHVDGITMTGLIDEDSAFETTDAYAGGIVNISPWRTHLDEELEAVDYLEDVVIEPSRMGNCSGNMIFVTRLQGGSIGGFEVIGPAGMDFHPEVEDPIETHVGEIIYVGTTVDDLDERYPWDSLDHTRDLRIHNIDNSAGYHHSQFVDLKIGTRDITVEYCTDRGAGQTTDAASAGAIDIKGNNHTIRWNDLGECLWGFLFGAWVPEPHDHHADASDWARYNEIYGNTIHAFSEDAFRFYDARDVTPEDQDVMCGNEVDQDEEKYAYALGSCGPAIPESERIGASST